MDLYPYLHQAGLNKSEATIYLYLLENGLSTPPMIARGTGIARTNCYNILEFLETHGLIEEQSVGKRKAFVATDPVSLVRTLDKKKESIEQILPDLRGLYVMQKNKPKIRFYDGLGQIQEIYRASLSAKKIAAIGSTKQMTSLMRAFYDEYIKEIKNRGITFQDILTKDSTAVALSTKQMLAPLYDMKFLPPTVKDPPTDILIWDDNIALLTLDEPIFGTVLTNEPLAQTFQMLAEILWEKL